MESGDQKCSYQASDVSRTISSGSQGSASMEYDHLSQILPALAMSVEHYETKLDDGGELRVRHEQSFEASKICELQVRIWEGKTIPYV